MAVVQSLQFVLSWQLCTRHHSYVGLFFLLALPTPDKQCTTGRFLFKWLKHRLPVRDHAFSVTKRTTQFQQSLGSAFPYCIPSIVMFRRACPSWIGTGNSISTKNIPQYRCFPCLIFVFVCSSAALVLLSLIEISILTKEGNYCRQSCWP